jgi:hypothetical protein
LPELAADHARRRPCTGLEAGGAPRLTQATRPRSSQSTTLGGSP